MKPQHIIMKPQQTIKSPYIRQLWRSIQDALGYDVDVCIMFGNCAGYRGEVLVNPSESCAVIVYTCTACDACAISVGLSLVAPVHRF